MKFIMSKLIITYSQIHNGINILQIDLTTYFCILIIRRIDFSYKVKLSLMNRIELQLAFGFKLLTHIINA